LSNPAILRHRRATTASRALQTTIPSRIDSGGAQFDYHRNITCPGFLLRRRPSPAIPRKKPPRLLWLRRLQRALCRL